MSKGSKAPPAPDPEKTASAQTATNIGTAVANNWLGNVNQVTPDGSLSYSQTGTKKWTDPTNGKVYELPIMTATQTLSEMQQKIKNQNDQASLNLGTIANQQSGKIGDLLNTTVDPTKLPATGNLNDVKAPTYQQFGSGPQLQTGIADAGAITKTYGTDFSQDRQKVEDALYARLNPQIDRDRASLESSLANKGIQMGSTAYTEAMANFDRGVNDQRNQIVLAGGQEQSRLAGLEAQRAAFENSAQNQQFTQNAANSTLANSSAQQMHQNQQTATQGNNALADQAYNQSVNRYNAQNAARQAALQEQLTLRNQPINEIGALLSGSQVSNPQFVNANMATAPTTDYAGLVQQNYANQMAQWQQNQASKQGLMGGLFGLGSAAIMASDRRLKTDVRRVGSGPLGLALYAYRYVWGGPTQIGVMAQDVLRVMPEAVVRMAGGFLAVDYGKLLARGA